MDDGNWFGFPWWLIFPVMGMAFGFFGMWSRHQRQRDVLRMIETYAAQGKEPPTALMDALSKSDVVNGKDDPLDWHGGRGRRRGLRTGIILLSLAAAFFLIDFLDVVHVTREEGIHPFLIPAIILGALGTGFVLMGLMANGNNLDEPKNRP